MISLSSFFYETVTVSISRAKREDTCIQSPYADIMRFELDVYKILRLSRQISILTAQIIFNDEVIILFGLRYR